MITNRSNASHKWRRYKRHLRLKCLYRMRNSTEQQNSTSTLSIGKFSSTIAYLKKKRLTWDQQTGANVPMFRLACPNHWKQFKIRHNVFLINVNKCSAKSLCLNKYTRLPFQLQRWATPSLGYTHLRIPVLISVENNP